jgi:hypothetical protein
VAGEVLVRAAGMVSPLGPTIEASCAAALAGIMRVAELPGLTGLDEEEVEPVPLKGHCITGLTEGFTGIARLARLGIAALQDLEGRSALGPESGRRIGMILALPSRYLSAVNSDVDVDQQPWGLPDTNPIAEERTRIEAQLIDLLADGSALPVLPTHRRIFFADQNGVAAGLGEASKWLSSGEVDDCILGTLDSYCDPCILTDLFDLRLLKAPDHPVGFIPGEGGVMLHLVGPSDTTLEPRPTITLSAPVVQPGGRHRFQEDPPIGDVIGKAIDTCLAESGKVAKRLTTDLNGDLWRSQNWGGALTRIEAGVANLPSEYVGEAFGEVGAVAGGFAICLAMHRAARWDETPIDTLVCLQGYDGSASAFMVSAEPTRGVEHGG